MPEKQTMKATLVTVISPSDSVHIMTRYKYVSRIGFKSKLIKPDKKRRLTVFRSILRKYRFYRQIKNTLSDVFHIHYAIAESSVLTFCAGKSPLIATTMGADILYKEQGDPTLLMARIGKTILRNCNHITAKTEYNKNVIQKYGVESDKISVIPWGIDTSVFYPKKSDSTYLSPQINSALNNKKVILQPRGLPAVYNNELILNALVELKKMHPQPFILWLPKAANQLECTEFLRLAKLKGVDDHVLVSATLEQSEINEALNRADVLVSVASSDGLPMSILEALAVGTPTIVGNLPHLTAALHDMNVVWTEFSPVTLAKNLFNCLELPLNNTHKSQLIKSSLDKFGLEKDLTKYRELIEKMKEIPPSNIRLARFNVLALYIGDRMIRRIAKLVGRKKMNVFYVRKT